MASFGNLPNASRSIIHAVSIESFLGRFATGIAYRITISPALHNPVFDMAAHQFRQIVKARLCGGLIREDEAVCGGKFHGHYAEARGNYEMISREGEKIEESSLKTHQVDEDLSSIAVGGAILVRMILCCLRG